MPKPYPFIIVNNIVYIHKGTSCKTFRKSFKVTLLKSYTIMKTTVENGYSTTPARAKF